MPKSKTPLQFCQPTRLDWPWRVAYQCKPGTIATPDRWFLVRLTSPSKLAADDNLLDHTKCLELGPHEYDNDAEAEAVIWVKAITQQIAIQTTVLRSWCLTPLRIEWASLPVPNAERPRKAATHHIAPAGIYTQHKRHTFLLGKCSPDGIFDINGDYDIICLIKRGRIAGFEMWEDPSGKQANAVDPTKIMSDMIRELKGSK